MEILNARFPYLAEEIACYESSPDGRARKLLAGLRPDADGRLNIVFACNNLGTITYSDLRDRLLEAEACDEMTSSERRSGLQAEQRRVMFASRARVVRPVAGN